MRCKLVSNLCWRNIPWRLPDSGARHRREHLVSDIWRARKNWRFAENDNGRSISRDYIAARVEDGQVIQLCRSSGSGEQICPLDIQYKSFLPVTGGPASFDRYKRNTGITEIRLYRFFDHYGWKNRYKRNFPISVKITGIKNILL